MVSCARLMPLIVIEAERQHEATAGILQKCISLRDGPFREGQEPRVTNRIRPPVALAAG
jgi:hypothetical protein